ncbi:hypothetical protein PAPYR_11778 [Paratrimastix pyriformis]|uniref:CWH43-like N-terminal domain-containing protein n=1 Tax=Paratrimastix pyriformis TaxID=342808 RepID=A0ABQ8U6T9_9EUKA|nr:hypothetical protein PAPYR_11778 [Paratrimastix pyriformis]
MRTFHVKISIPSIFFRNVPLLIVVDIVWNVMMMNILYYSIHPKTYSQFVTISQFGLLFPESQFFHFGLASGGFLWTIMAYVYFRIFRTTLPHTPFLTIVNDITLPVGIFAGIFLAMIPGWDARTPGHMPCTYSFFGCWFGHLWLLCVLLFAFHRRYPGGKLPTTPMSLDITPVDTPLVNQQYDDTPTSPFIAAPPASAPSSSKGCCAWFWNMRWWWPRVVCLTLAIIGDTLSITVGPAAGLSRTTAFAIVEYLSIGLCLLCVLLCEVEFRQAAFLVAVPTPRGIATTSVPEGSADKDLP